MMMSYRMFLVATVISIAGCGGGGAPPNQPPTVTTAAAVPTELSFIGGTVTITAEVTDDDTVATVSAQVAGPGGTETVALTLSGEQYAGDYVADGNPGPNEYVYTVTVTATDNKDATSDPVSRGFTVAAPSTPPPPPAFQL